MTLENSTSTGPNTPISIYDIRQDRQRLFILTILAVAGLLLPFSDSVYLPALAQIEHGLHASTILVDYTVSGYLIAAGLFGLLWGPLSDRFGRKIILLISFIVFFGFTIVCILARSIIILLVFRAFQGAAISCSLVVGQSAIVDMYPPDKLGFAIGLFLVPFLVGPILGPFVGGVLANTFGWRSTFISLAIMATISVLMILLFVPETHHYIVLQRLSSDAEKDLKKRHPTKTTFIREADTISKPIFRPPWGPFVFLADMTIAPHVVLCNVNFATLFAALILMSNREAQEPYALSPLHIGFTYVPTGVASLLGSLSGGWVSDWSAKRFCQATEGRLIFSLLGSLLCPLGLLLCGWTFHFGTHLAAPLIGTTLFCFGEAFMYTSCCAFVNVKKPAMAGSILALINSLGFMCSGVGIVFAVPLVTSLQFGPLYSLLAGLAFLLALISMIVVVYQFRSSNSSVICSETQTTSSSSETCTLRSQGIISIQWF